MTKSLEQIQEENRKFILEAIHNCNYKEALQKELGFGCKVIASVWNNIGTYIIDNLTCFFDGYCLRFRELVGDISKKDLTDYGLKNLKEYESAKHRILSIIGKPITLNRVLKGIEACGNYGCIAGHICKVNRKQATYTFICEWNLELETLEEQSEETQRAINELLNGVKICLFS